MRASGPAGAMTHVNVVYRSAAELVSRVADEALQGLSAGDAVLVCLPGEHWPAIRGAIGRSAGSVTFMAPEDRYRTPVRAMAALSEFVEGQLGAGAAGVRSIGRIEFAGGAADAGWVRYEAAVNDVFAGVPLRAVCLTDAGLAPAMAELLARTHHTWDDGHGERSSPAFDPRSACEHLPPAVAVPARPADLDLAGGPLGAARRKAAAAVAASLPPEQVDAVLLVATELLTNATRHGDGPGRLQLWNEPDGAVLAVSDGGPGIRDPYYGLRPARGSGGRGLWLIGHLCDAMSTSTSGGVHTVTARVPAPSPDRHAALA